MNLAAFSDSLSYEIRRNYSKMQKHTHRLKEARKRHTILHPKRERLIETPISPTGSEEASVSADAVRKWESFK